MTLQIVQDEAADEVLSNNAFALLCGMLLQEQVPIDVAFAGPAKILDRFGAFDPVSIEAASSEAFAELLAAEPPIHPYPESMSVLIQAVARLMVVNYGGDTASMWETAGSGDQLLSRLVVLPGFSKRKAQMFVALLGKQLGVRPQGWEEAAGLFSQPDVHRSVADVRDPESLEKVRNAKTNRKKGKDNAGDGPNKDRKSSHNQESKGSRNVKTDEEKAEKAERIGARKAARKAARLAANQGVAGEAVVDPETGETSQPAAGRGGGKRGGAKAKKAAKKAAKRAARRAARGSDPDAPASQGSGRAGGRAGKKGGGARNARKRAAAGPAAGPDDEGSAAGDVAPGTDGDESATSETEQPDEGSESQSNEI